MPSCAPELFHHNTVINKPESGSTCLADVYQPLVEVHPSPENPVMLGVPQSLCRTDVVSQSLLPKTKPGAGLETSADPPVLPSTSRWGSKLEADESGTSSQLLLQRHRVQVGSPQITTLRTALGKVQRWVTTYRVKYPIYNNDIDDTFAPMYELETETTYKFIPYRWVVRMGINRSLAMNIAQGWQTTIAVYRVRTNFENCTIV